MAFGVQHVVVTQEFVGPPKWLNLALEYNIHDCVVKTESPSIYASSNFQSMWFFMCALAFYHLAKSVGYSMHGTLNANT